MKQEFAQCAGTSSQQTSIPKQEPVPGAAEISYFKIRDVRPAGKEPVYNMEVEGCHNFAVNGGIIVHNCMDAMRYFVETKQIYRQRRKYDSLLT